jgi:hypothetical protein
VPQRVDRAASPATDALDTALHIVTNIASAHTGKAIVMVNADLDWHGAEWESRRALASRNRLANAHVGPVAGQC